MLQNEVLFSSEGLTLLGLDRLYSFKSALAVYARFTYGTTTLPSPISPTTKTLDSTRLEDAVDALRRLVLANGGRPISKSDLFRSYDWLGVNSRALKDVESMYRRAYGGLDRTGAFEMTHEERERETKPVIKLGAPPPPKTPPRTQTTPILKLNTQLATATTTRIFKPTAKLVPQVATQKAPPPIVVDAEKREADKPHGTGDTKQAEIKIDSFLYDDNDDDDGNENREENDGKEDEGDRTARPIPPGLAFWNGASIDSMMLSPRESQQSQRLGPLTPNGYEDISPVTRGEWGFLFKGDGWQQGKTAAVETC